MQFYKLTHGESIADFIDRRRSLMRISLGQASSIDIFAVSFEHIASYLRDAKPVSLIALIHLQQNESNFFMQAGLLPATSTHIANLENADPDLVWLQEYVASHHAPWLDLSAPLLLEPIYIPKPWGQEIWFTGIEARGQSRVSDGHFSVPLPWVLELLPQKVPLTLLKILDPLPHEHLGNLYFELHEQKQEVYIVTEVDLQAWPDGVGQIQMGFCQEKRSEYASDTLFKEAYLEVVNEYRDLRRIIDDALEQLNSSDNLDRVALYDRFTAASDNQLLIERESELRKKMNRFIHHRPLQVGDIIKVPCYVPHSLQHGVRVVEFQTPVYERKILSFGQKVLTQMDWDTEEAMAIAWTEVAQLEVPDLLCSTQAYQLERIVNFEDFQVQRLMVLHACKIPLKIKENTLVMLIKGEARFSSALAGDKIISQGQAYWITPQASQQDFAVESGSIVLVAMPNNSDWAELV